ncbi:MAG: ABC transporter substrate-binding protein [Anaerolineales bacterium]|nr:ABC transporter substrate-binding protein [Anaerolineales bacterium]
MIKHLLFISLLLASIWIGISACASRPTTSYPPLRIAWSDWPGDCIIWVAEDQGFFAKHKVQVEPVYYAIFNPAIADVTAGKIDGAFTVVGNVVTLVNNDNVRAVMIIDSSEGADQIVASAEIRNPADLRGKRIGVMRGTYGHLFALQMFEANHILPSEVTFVDIQPEQVPQAIPELIDAGHTWEPYTSEALARGQKIIFSSAQTPGLLPDVLFIRTATLQERSDEVRAFVAAMLEAVQFTLDNPEAAVASIAKKTGFSAETISFDGIKLYTLEDNKLAFGQNPGIDTTSIYYTANLYIELFTKIGILTSRPNPNQFLDPSFLP